MEQRHIYRGIGLYVMQQKGAIMEIKTCSRCEISQSIDNFYHSKVRRVPRPYCKPCNKELSRSTVSDKITEKDLPTHKKCSECDHEKSLDGFPYDKHRPDRKKTMCKECFNIKSSIYYKKNTDKKKNQILLKCYNITIEEYNKLLISQDSKCGICNNYELTIVNKTNKPKQLAVDHDHKTGKVRGLLCQKCNTGIGNLKDSIELLDRAIQYLKKYE